jgi:hypothetical protein
MTLILSAVLATRAPLVATGMPKMAWSPEQRRDSLRWLEGDVVQTHDIATQRTLLGVKSGATSVCRGDSKVRNKRFQEHEVR